MEIFNGYSAIENQQTLIKQNENDIILIQLKLEKMQDLEKYPKQH